MQFGEPGRRLVRVLETGRSLHLRDHRIERAVLMVRRAEIAQPNVRFGGDPLGQRLGEAGLAHARFGGNQHHPAAAGLRLRPAAEQQLHLLVAADQRRGARAQCLELAERAVFRHDVPCRHRRRQALEFDGAEVAALEQPADLPAGRCVDHHLIRPGEALQTGGEVRRLADRGVLAGVAGADRLTYDDEACRDADADVEWFAAHWCRADRRGDGETGAHGAFGIGLPGFRPAEIDQHPVADIACDEAVEPLDRGGDARLVSADDLTQILGIEPCRKGGRADEIAEHHAERAAFGRGF